MSCDGGVVVVGFLCGGLVVECVCLLCFVCGWFVVCVFCVFVCVWSVCGCVCVLCVCVCVCSVCVCVCVVGVCVCVCGVGVCVCVVSVCVVCVCVCGGQRYASIARAIALTVPWRTPSESVQYKTTLTCLRADVPVNN